MRRRLRYIELKSGYNDNGPASIGWVSLSKTGHTIYYRGRALQRISGGETAGNHRDVETGEEYWVSGVKKDRHERHDAGVGTVVIDDDARDDYERIVGKPAG